MTERDRRRIERRLRQRAAWHGLPVDVPRVVDDPEYFPMRPPKPELLAMADIEAMRAKYRIGRGHNAPGVYFLWDAEGLMYIGKSVQPSLRLRAHFMQRVDNPGNAMWFSDYASIEVPREWLGDIEVAYIRRERPAFNVQHNF